MTTPFDATTLLHQLTDPIFVKDKDHTWVFVNQAFADMVGLPIQDLLGKTDADYMPKEIYEVFWREDDNVVITGHESHQEEDISTPVGAVRRLLTKKSRIEQDGVFYVFGIIRDVTEVSRNARLIHLGHLAASLSHELMTPITVMEHYLKSQERILNERQPTAEETSKFVTTMVRAKDRLMTTIMGMKSLAKDGKDFPQRSVSLQEVVEDARELAMPRMNLRQAELLVKSVPNIQIFSRGAHITQILVNLLHNAADAVAELPEKWIGLEFTHDTRFVEIRVRDAGAGIPPKVAKKLMTPFFTTKHSSEGMGLGLSLAAKMAVEHQGELRLLPDESNTCFLLRLPMAS